MIDFKNKKIWIIWALILVILYNQSSLSDKKESSMEWGRVGIGLAGLVIGIGLWFVPGGQVTGTMIGIGSVGLIGGAGSLFSGISGLLTPDKGIPVWAWIAGFFVLMMFVMKKK